MSSLTSGLLLLILAVQVTEAQGLKVFFGNLHSHTSYSDGSGKPKDAYKRAKTKAHLDFVGWGIGSLIEQRGCERGPAAEVLH